MADNFSLPITTIKKFQDELKVMKKRDLERLCEEYGVPPRKSLKWIRVRLAYSYQEKIRNSFGVPTPENVLKRIKDLDNQLDVLDQEDIVEIKDETKQEKERERRCQMGENKVSKMGIVRDFLKETPSTKEGIIEKIMQELPDESVEKVKGSISHYLYKWMKEEKVIRKDGLYHWVG